MYAYFLNNSIQQELGISIEERFLEKRLEKSYYMYKHTKDFYNDLLKRISPKLIVEVVSYDTGNMIINEVAKELNIPTIELQHGVIARGHAAYNFFEKKQFSFFPDKIFLFSNYWKSVAQYPLSDENLIVTGFPFLEESLKRYLKQKKITDALRIIVLSQPGVFQLYNMIMAFIQKLDSEDVAYSIIYKLHPKEYGASDECWDVLSSYKNVSLIMNNEYPIHYYLAKSDIQIGVTSTAIFEGLAYKLKTFVYNIGQSDIYMGDICEKKYARMFDSADELFDIMNDDEWFNPIPENEFFVPNAKENMINEINKYLEGY